MKNLELWVVAFALAFAGSAATYVTCPGCIPRDRVNTNCEWSGDSSFAFDASNAGHRQHLVEDAQLAEELGIRYADAEFARRDIPRRELLEMIAAAEREVAAALTALPAASLDLDFPEPIRGAIRKTGDHLIRLTSHLGYHLGQVNYHRRVTTAGRESRVEGRA